MRAVFPGLAPWAFLLDPFRVGAGVVPGGGGCALFSQGLRPGLSCSTLSGSSASVIRVSFSYVGKTCDDPHGSCAATDCQPSRASSGVHREPADGPMPECHVWGTASALRGILATGLP